MHALHSRVFVRDVESCGAQRDLELLLRELRRTNRLLRVALYGAAGVLLALLAIQFLSAAG